MDYLIIGGGPAGISAAATLRRVDEQSSVTILSNEESKPYAKMTLPYLLAGTLPAEDLFLAQPEGVEILLGQEVTKVDPDQRQVTTAMGEVFPYDKLLIATGASPKKPPVQGGDLPFVFTVRDLADIHGMQKRVHARTGHAVIAGGGPVGLEVGGALHELGMKVTYVIGSPQVFSTGLDMTAAEMVEQRMVDQGVEVRKGERIVEIRERGEALLSSGETRACDLVVFGKGIRPNTGFLEDSGIEIRTGIVVDEHQETSANDIYAAGDVAETMDLCCGKWRCNAIWPVAVEQGKVAALNMASGPVAYEGSVSRNILRAFGVSIFVAGMGKREDLDVRRKNGRNSYHKIVLDDGMLKGIVFVGGCRHEGFYVQLMKRKIDVSVFADSLLKGTFCYPRFMRRTLRMCGH
jgi:nitrite reductase (NADH) large subunit